MILYMVVLYDDIIHGGIVWWYHMMVLYDGIVHDGIVHDGIA